MSLKSLSKLVRLRRWPRIFGSALGIFLLTAVPAFGLIYTGNWVIRQNRQTGGAPQAVIVSPDPSTLIVDMGVNSRRHSASTVIARRTFVVENKPLGIGHNNSGEQVRLMRSFTTLLRDASVRVTTRIIPNRGWGADQFFQNVHKGSARMIGEDRTIKRSLRPGGYTLEIRIQYRNRKGFWDNDMEGSPHRFTLSSI